jgi:hypothetical protein
VTTQLIPFCLFQSSDHPFSLIIVVGVVVVCGGGGGGGGVDIGISIIGGGDVVFKLVKYNEQSH